MIRGVGSAGTTTMVNQPTCIFCLKSFLPREKEGGKTGTRFEKHLRLLHRYLNIVEPHQSSKISAAEMNCCQECYSTLDSFCQWYHQLKIVELRVEWRVWKLKKIMKLASRRNGKELGGLPEWRSMFLKKCSGKLSARFPQVTLLKLKESKKNSDSVEALEKSPPREDVRHFPVIINGGGGTPADHPPDELRGNPTPKKLSSQAATDLLTRDVLKKNEIAMEEISRTPSPPTIGPNMAITNDRHQEEIIHLLSADGQQQQPNEFVNRDGAEVVHRSPLCSLEEGESSVAFFPSCHEVSPSKATTKADIMSIRMDNSSSPFSDDGLISDCDEEMVPSEEDSKGISADLNSNSLASSDGDVATFLVKILESDDDSPIESPSLLSLRQSQPKPKARTPPSTIQSESGPPTFNNVQKDLLLRNNGIISPPVIPALPPVSSLPEVSVQYTSCSQVPASSLPSKKIARLELQFQQPAYPPPPPPPTLVEPVIIAPPHPPYSPAPPPINYYNSQCSAPNTFRMDQSHQAPLVSSGTHPSSHPGSVVQSIQKLRQIHWENGIHTRAQTCRVCGRVFLDPASYTEHVTSHHGVEGVVHPLDIIRCDLCPAYFLTPVQLSSHMLLDHDGLPEEYLYDYEEEIGRWCELCKKLFLTSALRREHHRNCHEPSNWSNNNSSSSNLIKCQSEQCLSFFPTLEQLHEHLARVHWHLLPPPPGGMSPAAARIWGLRRTGKNCAVCPKWFIENKDRVAHYIKFHDTTRLKPHQVHTCTVPGCSAYFLTPAQAQLHLIEIHQQQGRRRNNNCSRRLGNEEANPTYITTTSNPRNQPNRLRSSNEPEPFSQGGVDSSTTQVVHVVINNPIPRPEEEQEEALLLGSNGKANKNVPDSRLRRRFKCSKCEMTFTSSESLQAHETSPHHPVSNASDLDDDGDMSDDESHDGGADDQDYKDPVKDENGGSASDDDEGIKSSSKSASPPPRPPAWPPRKSGNERVSGAVVRKQFIPFVDNHNIYGRWCSICKWLFLTVELLQEHQRLCHHSPPPTSDSSDNVVEVFQFQCKIDTCPTRLPTLGLLAEHLERAHGLQRTPQKALAPTYTELEIVELTERRLWCTVCKTKFANQGHFRLHTETVHGSGEHKCKEPGCDGAYFRTEPHLWAHIRRVHPESKAAPDLDRMRRRRYYCAVCPKWTCRPNEVVKHFNSWHDLKKELNHPNNKAKAAHQCPERYCPTYVLTVSQLVLHLKRDHGKEEDPRKRCDDCGKSFKTRNRASYHRRVAHLKNSTSLLPFVCKEVGCGMGFEKEVSLQIHVRMKHDASSSNRRRMECSHCGRVFRGKSALQCHVRNKHDMAPREERPFICDLCGKGFRFQENYNLHKLAHSGPESWEFSCDQCGKKCLTKQKLEEHRRTHSAEKPYVCQYCGTKYAHRHNLRIHVNSKHPEEMRDTPGKFDKTNLTSRKGLKKKKKKTNEGD